MNWEALGAIGEIAGAAGVIVTLIYLSFQIRQNTKASRQTAVQTATENSASFTQMLATDGELNELFWRGLLDPDTLDAAELRRFFSALNVFMRRESVAFYLHREGMMPDEIWNARVATLAGIVNQPGTRRFLDTTGYTMPAAFLQFMLEVTSKESIMTDGLAELVGAKAGTWVAPESST